MATTYTVSLIEKETIANGTMLFRFEKPVPAGTISGSKSSPVIRDPVVFRKESKCL